MLLHSWTQSLHPGTRFPDGNTQISYLSSNMTNLRLCLNSLEKSRNEIKQNAPSIGSTGYNPKKAASLAVFISCGDN